MISAAICHTATRHKPATRQVRLCTFHVTVLAPLWSRFRKLLSRPNERLQLGMQVLRMAFAPPQDSSTTADTCSRRLYLPYTKTSWSKIHSRPVVLYNHSADESCVLTLALKGLILPPSANAAPRRLANTRFCSSALLPTTKHLAVFLCFPVRLLLPLLLAVDTHPTTSLLLPLLLGDGN